MKFIVTQEDHGKTLLSFLKEKEGGSLSSNQIKKAIEAKSCKVNGRIECFASYLLRETDQIEFSPFLEEGCLIKKVSILFEDPFFVLIDKPPGLVSENEKVRNFIGTRAKHWNLVHRLDKETSGLLLLAKTEQAERAAQDLFAQREVEKLYLAIVDGKLKEKSGFIDNLLGKKGGYQGQTLYGEVKEKGVRALTHFRTLAESKHASLVLCDLKTGRTHQIRVHLSEKGHPLLGDHQYGSKGFTSDYLASRHLLHAWKLSFIHPFTQKKIEVESPLPFDFQNAVKELFPSFKKI